MAATMPPIVRHACDSYLSQLFWELKTGQISFAPGASEGLRSLRAFAGAAPETPNKGTHRERQTGPNSCQYSERPEYRCEHAWSEGVVRTVHRLGHARDPGHRRRVLDRNGITRLLVERFAGSVTPDVVSTIATPGDCVGVVDGRIASKAVDDHLDDRSGGGNRVLANRGNRRIERGRKGLQGNDDRKAKDEQSDRHQASDREDPPHLPVNARRGWGVMSGS